METYTFLRELADSWVLLAMTLFFLGMIAGECDWWRLSGHRVKVDESVSYTKQDRKIISKSSKDLKPSKQSSGSNEANCRSRCAKDDQCQVSVSLSAFKLNRF